MTASMLAPEIGVEQRESLLGRTNPLVKLGIALAWLVGLGLTLDVRPPLILAVVVLVAGLQLGGLTPDVLARRMAPLAIAVLGIATANLLFSAHNPDPAATELLRIGPLRLTVEAVEAAAGLGARVASIVSVGAVFALTTDATRLIDSLVQLARVSPRFAYGALAAYQAVPRLAEDLATLRSARRLRGLREWHPRLLVGLLVRAIRHADQLSIAMDARGFGGGPRTTYRPIAWTNLDAAVTVGGLVILVVALVVSG
jgi:energy-coupling factor transport system permease protein